jgi:hypothetical protein
VCRYAQEDAQRDPHKYTIHMGRFDLPGVYRPLRHATCPHNEKVAIVNRVLKKVPTMTDHGRKMGWREISRLKQAYCDLETPEIFLSRYSGAKRQRYERAIEANAIYGLPPWAGKITMFVKNESIRASKKVNPDPRAIQFRDEFFASELALYLKPIEHQIYQTRLYGKRAGVGRVIGKGLNMRERADLIFKKFYAFEDCVVVSIDAKRFDLHVNRELLEMEHAYYRKFNNDPHFAELLKKQLHNVCTTRSGFKYEVPGGRMSGDMNTGLGNCVISLIMFLALRRQMGVRMDLLVDGDDALLFLERKHLELLRSKILPTYLAFGMEMEIADVADQMEHIDWCQTRPVNMGTHWVMVRDPIRTLSHVLVSKKWQPARQRDYMAAIALCEMSLNKGVPVLQAMSETLWNNSSQRPNVLDTEKREALFSRVLNFNSWDSLVAKGIQSQPIESLTRLSFQAAFGITVTEQVAWEHYLHQWRATFGQITYVDDYWDVANWCPVADAPVGFCPTL